MARQVERLTALGVKGLTNPGMYPDGGGLYLNVAAGGSKSWIFRYRLNGRRRDMGLGAWPLISLATARERTNLHRRDLADKVDPLAKREKQREMAKAQARSEAKARGVTFRAVAEACILAKRDAWKPAQEHQWQQSLIDHVYPRIGNRPVAEIDIDHVVETLNAIWLNKNQTAQRVRRRIEAILDFAAVRGYRNGDNPARMSGNLEHLLPKVDAKVKHHAALLYAEVPEFLAKVKACGKLAASALEFTILTATRTDEVRDAIWAEFDLERAVWAIPAERMKMKQDHVVPLSPPALAVLTRLPKGADQPFKMGDRTMYYLARELQPGITVHGFRSTFRDWAYEETEFSNEIVEHCLAHIEGSASELAYKRGGAVERRRRVMEAWAQYCCGEEVSAEVIELRAAGG